MSSLQEGFQEQKSGNFWNIKNGLIVRRVSEGTEGAVEVKDKEGNVRWEIQKKSFTGKLRHIDIRTHEQYGEFMAIVMIANGENVRIECNLDSGYAYGFLSTIPNHKDLKGLLMLSPSYTEKDGKKESKIFLQNDAGWLKQYFTKENPNGLPELKQVKVSGKMVWDGSERLDFFKSMITKLNTALDTAWGATPAATPAAAPLTAPAPVETIAAPTGNIPF